MADFCASTEACDRLVDCSSDVVSMNHAYEGINLSEFIG